MEKGFNYVSPEVEIILFNSKDIITLSDGVLDPNEDLWL